MNIAIFGGTFNPITQAHDWIVQELSDEFDKVLVVPTAVTWHKRKQDDEVDFTFQERVDMCKHILESYSNVEVLDIEEPYLGTEDHGFADTLAEIREMYGVDNEYTTVMGSDSFEILHLWKNHEYILINSHILVYDRPGYTSENKHIRTYVRHEVCEYDCSSTNIRKALFRLESEINWVYLGYMYFKLLCEREGQDGTFELLPAGRI